jgi:DNA polymerase-3 subunit epsilon
MHRSAAIYTARQWVSQPIVYLDTETTGLDERSEVIEIAILGNDGALLYESFVCPRGRISPAANNVHGISLAQVIDAPAWLDVWAQIQPILETHLVAVYNARFDYRLMQQSHTLAGQKWELPFSQFVCVMELYAQFHGKRDSWSGSFRWQSLDKARMQCGLHLPNSHRAADDARLTREVLHHVASKEI